MATMTEGRVRDALGDLWDDGDVVEVDGRRVRLRIEVDHDTTVDDFEDCYGLFRWERGSVRPAGFDGAAEVVDRDGRAGRLWWQPPADVQRGDSRFSSVRQGALDALRDGFREVILEVLDGADAYGRDVVRAFASCGGVEAGLSRSELVWLLEELWVEVTA